jgi:low temperature requirement protein LtrA
VCSSDLRDIHEQHRVSTPLELLFDLTFVVAISQASSQLHHDMAAHHTAQAITGYLLAFAAIWWAWMNYTWFASAYDNDDTLFRVLTMVQMGGVLVLAAGIPGLFNGEFMAGVIGYVVMRIALSAQWLRAARGDPLRRRTCLRYAGGVALMQLLWVAFLLAVDHGLLAGTSLWATMIILWVGELSVPVFAERAGGTPWHAHHIAERYGLMIIIVLGECVLGVANEIAAMQQAQGWSFHLALVGFAGMLLVFCLWWMYFLLPSADALHHHRERAWNWGYGHYITFAAVAAIGSGLELAADALKTTHEVADAHNAVASAAHAVSPLLAISMVASAEAIFVSSLWVLHRHVTKTQDRQLLVKLVCLTCIGLGPIAVALNLPLFWGLLLLCLGPLINIIYYEHRRQHDTEHFSVH